MIDVYKYQVTEYLTKTVSDNEIQQVVGKYLDPVSGTGA